MKGMNAAVAELRERPVSACDQAAGLLAPASTAAVAARRPSLFGGDFTLPVMVLRESAVERNVAVMAAWCAAAGVELAPHGKTTMAPQLFARQLAAGAWGVTAATAGHLRAYRAFGIPRILLANELTDPAGVAWLAGELTASPEFDCYVYVDSPDGIALLDGVLRERRAARPLPVLVELGQPGGRTGCRSVPEAVAVATAAAGTTSLRLAGAAGYEGSIGHDTEPGTLAAIGSFCRDLHQLAAHLGDLVTGPEPVIVSAGGSSYFDIVAAALTRPVPGGPPLRAVLRSGAYITHDHGLYAALDPGGPGQAGRTGPDLTPALELWAGVLSRPEPGLALLGAGRRDVSFDQGYPVPLWVRAHGQPTVSAAAGMRVTKLDDQHAYLAVPPDSPLAPGDLVGLGISHPCTAFDKWRLLPMVDDGYRVTDLIHTFF